MSRLQGFVSASLVLSFFSVSGLPARAQSMVDGLAQRFVVDGTHAAIETLPPDATQRAGGPTLPPPAPNVATAGHGLLWSQSDGGEGWIGRTVAVGDHGQQVFTEFDIAAHRAQLLSSFDAAPVSPLFVHQETAASANVTVVGSDDSDLFVSCRQVPVSGPNSAHNIVISVYSATDGPMWTYQFPTASYGPGRAMISRDGTRIVAGMLDATGFLQIRVFTPASNVPTWQGSVLNGPQLHSLLLSGDGSRLYWASATSCNVMNLATHQSEASFALFTALDCHAISDDGSVFAYGGFNTVDVYERQHSGSYLHTHQWNVTGQAVCSRIDVSADSSTIVAGFNLWDTNLGVKVVAFDVPTKAVTMTDVAIGAGTLQNIVSDIAVSANGDHFVVGLWGDEAGLVDDLRFYTKHQDAPIATYPYPGSVYDVALSADGTRVAVASKAVHANLYTGGGAIDLYAFGDEDFAMHGVPHLGSTVRFEMQGAPNVPARLLIAPSAAQEPMPFGGMGLLYLNRTTMTSMSMGTTDGTGHVMHTYTMPTTAAMIGTKRCFQGLVTSPRRLTQSWVEATILP